MRVSDFTRRVLGIGGAVALLSGCGGSQVGSSPWVPAGAARTLEPANYGWYKLQWYEGVGPPYSVRTKVRYFRGTVPVVMAGYNFPGGHQAGTFTLLDHTDSSGNYALYNYGVGPSGPVWSFSGLYMSSVSLDIPQGDEWAITKNGTVWSNVRGKWRRYFDNFTSLAVYDPTERNPKGYLFATSSKSKTNGSSARGPSGPTLMLYDPSKRWSQGAWRKTGWGAQQVTGDSGFSYDPSRLYLEVVVLDEKSDVWEILPAVRSSRFEDYVAIPLGTVECDSGHPQITFEEVAAYNLVFFALDKNKGHAVWYYEPTSAANGQCWHKIGSKSGFTSIASFTGPDGGVWAVDAKGNLWSVY